MTLEIDPVEKTITYKDNKYDPEMKYTYEVIKEPVNNIQTDMLYLEPKNDEAISDFKKERVLGLTGGILDGNRIKLNIQYFKPALFSDKEEDKLQILLNDSKLLNEEQKPKGGKRRKSRRNRKSKKSKKSRKNRKKSKRRSRR